MSEPTDGDSPTAIALADESGERASLASPFDSSSFIEDAESIGLRLMPRSDVLAAEPFWKRSLYLLLAAAFLVGYFWMLRGFWAPAHAGINQNGYLVGGKMLALHGTTGIKPATPYQFIGWMWNLVDRDPSPAASDIWYYPKYPLGTSALFAVLLKIDWDQGKIWSFYVNPVTMTLALGGMFMLTRLVAGSFIGFLGMMILAFSQVTLQFANQPLSHGPALCAVTWGMFFLIRWWQTASIWRGIFAGFLLGYAVTTRYTEGLLLLPMAVAMMLMIRFDRRESHGKAMSLWLIVAMAGVILKYTTTFLDAKWICIATVAIVAAPMIARAVVRAMPQAAWGAFTLFVAQMVVAAALVFAIISIELPPRPWPDFVASVVGVVLFKLALATALVLVHLIPWRQPRRYFGVVWPMLAWMAPVGLLVAFNWFAMHSITGYDSTNESTAFTWRTFVEKWDDTVQQMNDYSMYLIPPLAIAGLVLMYRWSWRIALLMTLWFVPGFLLYTAYYFGQSRPGMWYLRFFLTLFPPMVVAAMWLLRSAVDGARARFAESHSRGSFAVPIGLGIFTFCSCGVGLWLSLPFMERESAANGNLAYSCQRIVRDIPTLLDGKRVEPIVFADATGGGGNYALNNMLQFAGDFELYAADGFISRGVWWRTVDPAAPNPLQPARREYAREIFGSKSEAALIVDQNKVMRDALGQGRPVFAILSPGSAGGFKRFITADFQWKRVDQWTEASRVPNERNVSRLDPAYRGGSQLNTRQQQSWAVYQITLKPKGSSPAPTSQPTEPTTAPAPKKVSPGNMV